MSNIIHLDSVEYMTLYKNIYIKGLNSIVAHSGELVAYAVGVKLSSIYLKIVPAEPTFFFYFGFSGLGIGPSLTLTVEQEGFSSAGINSSNDDYVLLKIQEVENHVEFLKDMVPKNYRDYQVSKMTNFDTNTAILSGNAPTDITRINCPLEIEEVINNTSIFPTLTSAKFKLIE